MEELFREWTEKWTAFSASRTAQRPAVSSTERYSLVNLTLLFFLFSVIGWLWEVLYTGLQYGMFINRGVLHGPWLPIYGVGGVAAVVLLDCYRKKPAIVFANSVLIFGSLEFATSWVLERLFHEKWWDYSQVPLNIGGRVCVFGLLLFGVAGTLVVCKGAPFFRAELNKTPKNLRIACCVVLCVLFVADLAASAWMPNIGSGITTLL